MKKRRIPIGRITAVLAVVVGAIIITRTASQPRLRSLRPGLEFGMWRGEPYCRRGSSEIAVLRVDPARFPLRVAHYTTQPDGIPLDIMEWQHRLNAVAVFNAGQYYPDYSYMGLFVSGGRTISSRIHPEFQAALVADPKSGGPRARVLDLSEHGLNPSALPWREIAQSFMLFDRSGTLRVRKTPQIANRTAVAEDREGRIVILVTEGGYTLSEFAGLLKTGPLGLTHAMSMDGGDEAELCVRVDNFAYTSFGHLGRDGRVAHPTNPTVPLPAVIAVVAP